MSSVLPYEASCGLLIYVFCQKLKENDGWDAEAMSKETQRKVLIGILKIMRNAEYNWKGLTDRIKATCPEDLFLSFVKEAQALDNEDQLLNIFKALEDLVLDQHQTNAKLAPNSTLVKRTSVLGLFIRKLVLKFKKLSFAEIQILLRSICKYRDTSLAGVSKISEDSNVSETSQSMDLSCVDENTSDVSTFEIDQNKENVSSPGLQLQQPIEEDGGLVVQKNSFSSRSNVFKFIEEHVNMLESNAYEAPDPNKLQEKIEEIQTLHSNITDLYYLSFLNYLRVSEVNKASKMLCLYFDYKNFQKQSRSTEISEQEKHQTMFKRFRYGALNLGIMHCRHRNYNQAIIVLKEAVCIAQETNDDVCLKYAMFWIQVVKEETGQLNDRSIEGSCRDLVQNIYTEDEHVIDSVPDIECFGVLRCAKVLAFRGLRLPEFLLSNISRIVVSNSRVSDSALLTRSSILDFYGFKMLSLYNCQLPLQTLMKTKDKTRGTSEENLVIALCQLAVQLGKKCKFQEAFSILDFLRERQPAYSRDLQVLQKCRLEIQFERFVMERELESASNISEFVGVYDANECAYMKAVVDATRGNYTCAFDGASNLRDKLETQDNCTDPMLKVRVLFLLIELKLCSLKPTQAINDILDLSHYVESLNMHGFSIDIHICLIRYNLKFGLHDEAWQLIDEIFIGTLANGTAHQQGLLYFLQATCLVEKTLVETARTPDSEEEDDEEEEVGKVSSEEEKSKSCSQAVQLFEKALFYFQLCNAKARIRDVYYEESMVYHVMGLTHERNAVATKFRVLNEELKDGSDCIIY